MQREEEAQYAATAGLSHPSMQSHNHGPPLEDDAYDDEEEEEDSYDSQDDEDYEEDDMVNAHYRLLGACLQFSGSADGGATNGGGKEDVPNLCCKNV